MVPLLVLALLADRPQPDPDGLPLPDGVVARLVPARLRHTRPVHHLAFSPDGTQLATLAGGEAIVVWDVKTGRALARFGPAHDRVRNYVAWADDKSVVALLKDGALVRFDVGTRKEVYRTAVSNSVHCRDYWISPDASRVVVDAGVKMAFDGRTGRLLGPAVELPNDPFTGAVSPDGKLKAVGTASGAVLLIPTAGGPPLPQSGENVEPLGGLHITDGGAGVAFAAAAGDRVRLRVIETRTGRRAEDTERFAAAVRAVGLSPDGRFAACVGPDAEMVIADRRTGSRTHQLPTPGGPVRPGQTPEWAFLPDGRLAVAGRSAIGLFDPATGKEVSRITNRAILPSRLAASADGKRVFAVVRLANPSNQWVIGSWDTTTGAAGSQAVYSATGGTPTAPALPAAFAPSTDGGRLAIADGYGVRLQIAGEAPLQPHSRRVTFRRQANGTITQVVEGGSSEAGRLGPVDRWVAAAAAGPVAFDRAGRNVIAAPPAANPAVYATFESPSRTRLPATPPADGLRVYEAATGQLRATVPHDLGPLTDLVIAPDGRTVAGLAAGGGYVWDVYAPTPGGPAGAWAALASGEAADAFLGVRRLVAAGDAGVALVRAKLRPASADTLKLAAGWAGDLDSPRFADRDAAAEALAAAGSFVAPLLRKATTTSDSAEVRARAEALAAAAGRADLRIIRAVEALEVIGTADAKRLLAEYAAGDPDARLTLEARAAAARLAGGGTR